MKDGIKVIQPETAIYCSLIPLTRCASVHVCVCVCKSGYEFYYSSKIDSGPKAQASTHLQFQNDGEKKERKREMDRGRERGGERQRAVGGMTKKICE